MLLYFIPIYLMKTPKPFLFIKNEKVLEWVQLYLGVFEKSLEVTMDTLLEVEQMLFKLWDRQTVAELQSYLVQLNCEVEMTALVTA